MVMTHHLRAMHDVILVGVGTVLADDPRLNVRMLDDSTTPYDHTLGPHPSTVLADDPRLNVRMLDEAVGSPRPCVVDPLLR